MARLKANLPELYAQAQERFGPEPPHESFELHGERVELWDADDFDPWTSLRWPTARVLRYRQTKRGGQLVEAYWLTDFPRHQVSSRQLYQLAKSRWEVENQGFNDAKTRYGLRHVPHHHARSLEIYWLLLVFAMTLERLWRLRYLHRGTHPPRTAIELLRRLRWSLVAPPPVDTS